MIELKLLRWKGLCRSAFISEYHIGFSTLYYDISIVYAAINYDVVTRSRLLIYVIYFY